MLKKYNKKELYKFLGFALFAWYALTRWSNQGNTLGYFVTDEHGITSFVLAWIFAPINLATAFLTIYFVSKILVEFDKAFNPIMGLAAFFLFWRNFYYTLEDYSEYRLHPSSEQLLFIGIDIAMMVYVVIWAIFFWSMNRCMK
jgi:hypothetical protein